MRQGPEGVVEEDETPSVDGATRGLVWTAWLTLTPRDSCEPWSPREGSGYDGYGQIPCSARGKRRKRGLGDSCGLAGAANGAKVGAEVDDEGQNHDEPAEPGNPEDWLVTQGPGQRGPGKEQEADKSDPAGLKGNGHAIRERPQEEHGKAR